jgi:nitrilase
MDDTIKIGLAQLAPVWLNKEKTLEKIAAYIHQAGDLACDLIVFGEALLPGYPFWLSFTNGAEFNSKMQKEIHAHYVQNGVQIEKGDLDSICQLAKAKKVAIYLGMMERAGDRGGHSLYCSLVYIDPSGVIQSIHRKLQPTYEERLCWAPGDGHGLKVHSLGSFTVGGLNCWENWMPLSRTALYGMGENLHIAVWPGMVRNTVDITRFIAMESRSYVVSVSGLFRKEDIPTDFPHYDTIVQKAPEVMADGGSCIAGPDGTWEIEPLAMEEGLFVKRIDFTRVLEERQNFDVAGHYSRPDVTQLTLNQERQSILNLQKKPKK